MFSDYEDEEQNGHKGRRKIPWSLLILIIMQTSTGLWWAATFSSNTETRLEALERQQRVLDLLPERMARQEAQMESMNSVLLDIRDELRSLRTDARKR